jgi:hypothetical protein
MPNSKAVEHFLKEFKQKMKIWDVLFRDDRGKNDMWVFGRVIKKKQVYIKITMGFKGASVLCISFHLAEHELNFPLK